MRESTTPRTVARGIRLGFLLKFSSMSPISRITRCRSSQRVQHGSQLPHPTSLTLTGSLVEGGVVDPVLYLNTTSSDLMLEFVSYVHCPAILRAADNRFSAGELSV